MEREIQQFYNEFEYKLFPEIEQLEETSIRKKENLLLNFSSKNTSLENDLESNKRNSNNKKIENIEKKTFFDIVPLKDITEYYFSPFSFKLRAIIIDWIIEIHYKLKYKSETLFLAINIFDKFYVLETKINSNSMQLVGITSLYIASKLNESKRLTFSQCCFVTANQYTQKNVLEMEEFILKTLKFSFSYISPCFFFMRNLLDIYKEDNYDVNIGVIGLYFVHITLFNPEFFKYKPSEIADAAVVLSCRILNKNFEIVNKKWENNDDLFLQSLSDLLINHANYSKSDLRTLQKKFSKVFLIEEFKNTNNDLL